MKPLIIDAIKNSSIELYLKNNFNKFGWPLTKIPDFLKISQMLVL